MSLIATARALDDQRFLWRVRAAALNLATTKYSSSDPIDKGLASDILDYPMRENKTLEALVANDSMVSSLVEIDEYSTVSTENVTDVCINEAVARYWNAVAQRRSDALKPTTA